MKVVQWIKRIALYLIGLFIIGLGVNVSLKSDLGVSTNNALPLVISKKLPFLSLGNWVTVVFCAFVLLQLILLLKDFKWYYVFQVVASLFFGLFVDLGEIVLAFLPSPELYILRILYSLIAVLLIALGIMIYLECEVMSLPAEGVAVALSKKTKLSVPTCKLIFDVFSTLLAVIFSFIFFGTLVGVREGTVMIAIGVGPVMKLLSKVLKKPIRLFLYGNEQKEKEIEQEEQITSEE